MRILLLPLAILAASSLAAVGQEHRELGPHVHGVGSLKIAVEGKTVSLDFSAPANDIIGFEHQPTTPEQTKTLEDAKSSLAAPLTLFAFPTAAKCTVTSSDIKFNAAEPGAAKEGEAEHQHADFDVDYELACAAPENLTLIEFPYFKRFAGAQKLTVTAVTDHGQSEFEVTGAAPSHALN